MSIKLSNKYGFDTPPTERPTKKIKYTTTNKTDSTYVYFPTKNKLPHELYSLLKIVEQLLIENDTIKYKLMH